MATWSDVRDLALGLPEAIERDGRECRVRGKLFVWKRGLSEHDRVAMAAQGTPVPDGPTIAVRVPDLGVKEALLADDPDVFFTIPHFDGFPGVMIRLDRITDSDLGELIVEAWLVQAPKRVGKTYLASIRGAS
jgi:hypothetical protein